MSAARCIACGSDWGDWFPCRLVDEAAPEDWIQVHICTACWRAAERQHQARLREHERRLLADWYKPNEDAAQR